MIATEDIVYRRIDGRDLLARLYKPAGVARCPVLIDVHGGAWVSGDRMNNAALATRLAARGIVVMSIDFQLGGEAPCPASITDVNHAVRWLKAQAASHGVTADGIGLLGTSSGAHQALLTALRPHDPDYGAPEAGSGPDASVDFIVACWPIADPLARYRMAQQRGIDHLLRAHETYFADEAQMETVNPQRVLERGEAQSTPPLLILQGTADENVTADMADRLAAAYRTAGGRVVLRTFEHEPHMFATKQPDSNAARLAIDAICRFVEDVRLQRPRT